MKDQGIDLSLWAAWCPIPGSKVREGITLARAEGVDFIPGCGRRQRHRLGPRPSATAFLRGGCVGLLQRQRLQPERVCQWVRCSPPRPPEADEQFLRHLGRGENGLKWGLNNDICRCRFAVMDPELTYTLPPYQTACGVVDILPHTMERYFTMRRIPPLPTSWPRV